MRILYLTQGVTGHDRRMTALLAGAGHRVHYLALDDVSQAPLPDGVRWEAWAARPSVDARAPEGARALVPALREVLDRVRPDAVHAGPVQTAGYAAALADARPRLVMSWGSDVLVDADRGPAWAEATRTALADADGFVFDCRTVLQRARDFAQIADERVALFPWGTDLTRFSPGASPLRAELSGGRGDAFVVLCTRSWEPIYGMDTLVKGFARAWRREPRLRLVLPGGGSLAAELDGWIRDAGVEDAVLRPGPVDHAALPDWFRAADLYASCAHSDGSSISLLEAMATGLPVLVTDIPPNREWVTVAENGWLAGVGDADGVADALLAAVRTSGAERAEIGARNRRVVEERADWPRVARPLLALYEGLAADAPSLAASAEG
ncbi:glycosyltransferase family 4 protein [Longimicrobium sp.]|uniref:glycosyltransferase family 4 protein n=1 Tax=Longimicrobium sp. TaxID=2029185 RepID=UPI003B3A7B31